MAEQKTVRRGDTVTVVLSSATPPRRKPAPAPGPLDPPDGAARPSPPAELKLFHLHTLHDFSTATGLNTYSQIRLETSVVPRDYDAAVIRYALLTPFRETTALGSGRTIWSTAPAQGDSINTDGLLAAATYHSQTNDAEVSSPIQGNTSTWSPRVPYQRRLADIDAQIAADTAAVEDETREPGQYQQDLLEARARVALEGNESWTTEARAYATKDGTLRTRLLDGAHTLGFTSTHHLQSWEGWDTVNFSVTELPTPLAPAVEPPAARVSPTTITRHEVFAAPQVFQYTVRWQALYYIGTLFFFSLVALPQTGAFADALPLLPIPYRLAGSAQNANNAYAVSRFVETTATYQRMLAADYALEIYSPYFFVILTGRIGGHVQIFVLNQPVKRLCAIVKQYEQGGEALTRYVWGRTRLTRTNSLIDDLPLNTFEVIGDDTLFTDE